MKKQEKKYKIVLLIFLSLAILTSISFNNNFDEEKITNFLSSVSIEKDKSINIVEEIEIFSKGENIIHGIERYLPIAILKENLQVQFFKIEVKNVLLDGKPEKYSIKSHKKDFLIKIGEKDKIIPYGLHKYTLAYSIKNIIETTDYGYYFLNLPIVGEYTNLKIDNLSIIVKFPEEIEDNNFDIFYYDAIFEGKNQNINKCDIEKSTDGKKIYYKIKQPLFIGEYLSIRIHWQGNIFSQNNLNNIEKINSFFEKTNLKYLFFRILAFISLSIDYIKNDESLLSLIKSTIFISLISFFLIILFKIYAYFSKNKNFGINFENLIISPADSHFSLTDYNKDVYILSILSLISKKIITIKKDENGLVLIKNKFIDENELDKKIDSKLKKLFLSLFDSDDKFYFSNKNSQAICQSYNYLKVLYDDYKLNVGCLFKIISFILILMILWYISDFQNLYNLSILYSFSLYFFLSVVRLYYKKSFSIVKEKSMKEIIFLIIFFSLFIISLFLIIKNGLKSYLFLDIIIKIICITILSIDIFLLINENIFFGKIIYKIRKLSLNLKKIMKKNTFIEENPFENNFKNIKNFDFDYFPLLYIYSLGLHKIYNKRNIKNLKKVLKAESINLVYEITSDGISYNLDQIYHQSYMILSYCLKNATKLGTNYVANYIKSYPKNYRYNSMSSPSNSNSKNSGQTNPKSGIKGW